MKILNTRSVYKLLVGFALFCLLINTQSFAVGTDVGLDIDNQATINYSVGGTPQGAITSDDPNQAGANDVTTFTVDRKIDMAIVASPTSAGATASIGDVVELTVTNNGNGTQTFVIDYFDFTAGDDLDVASVTYYEDDPLGADPGNFDVGDTLVTEISLDEDEIKTIFAFAILSGSTNGQTSTAYYSLIASDGAGSPIGDDVNGDDGGTANTLIHATVGDTDIVFADGANAAVATNTAGDDVAEDGLVSVINPVTYTIAGLIVEKTVSVTANPAGVSDANPKAVPGATVTYALSIENTGATDATDVDVSDTLPATVQYVGGTIDFSDPECTGTPVANITDQAFPLPDTVGVDDITVAAGADCDITFDAIIQ